MSKEWNDIRQQLKNQPAVTKGTILGVGLGMPNMGLSQHVFWPKEFLTGEVDPNISVEEAIAIACMGWGLCHSGTKPPAKFGEGMAGLGQITGCLLPEDFLKKADEIIAGKEQKND